MTKSLMKNLFLYFGLALSNATLFADESVKPFEEISIENFPMLNTFDSVQGFEISITEYRSLCLANSFSGALARRCYVGRQLWERELNYAHRQLEILLSEDEKQLLKRYQESWRNSLKDTELMASMVVNKTMNQPGTMFKAIRAQMLNDSIATLLRQRTLLLRDWYFEIAEAK